MVFYGVEDFCIFVLVSNVSIKDKFDFKGKKVGVIIGIINESWVWVNLKELDICVYDNGGFVFNDLGNGCIDVVISLYFGGMKYVNVNKLLIKEVGLVLIY